MDLGLARSHVLVAGASRGLGFAVVSRLLEEGAAVTAIGRNEESLDAAHSRWLREEPQADVRTFMMDLSDPTAVRPLAAAFPSGSRLDGLIVVAGSGAPSEQPPTRAIDIASPRNVLPALVAIEACGHRLRESLTSAIVIVSSIAGVEYLDCPPEYAAAKASLRAYAAHWSRELRPVRVNVLAPGNMLTEGSVWHSRMCEDPSGLSESLARDVTLGRLAHPDEVARVAVFLMSQAASFMTGTTVVVDGGQVRQW